jgi:hypothetical protein
MVEKHEHSRRNMVYEPVRGDWFDAYIQANKKFALIPTAIDAAVGLAVLRPILDGRSTWRQLLGSRFSDQQREKAEEVMTRMHMPFNIPLVGASQSAAHHESTRDMLAHFVHHHKRPLKTPAYEINAEGTHMVVDPEAMHKTWTGIVGETVRAALVFGKAVGFRERSIARFNVHATPRSVLLQAPIVKSLDRSFSQPENDWAFRALVRLYKAANDFGKSKEGSAIAKHHRGHFDLSKSHGQTPFKVTDHLRAFNLGIRTALERETEVLRAEGIVAPHIEMQPFFEEMTKHGRLT